ANQRGIHKTENCSAGSGTHRQNQNCNCREPGALVKLPQSVAHILKQTIHFRSFHSEAVPVFGPPPAQRKKVPVTFNVPSTSADRCVVFSLVAQSYHRIDSCCTPCRQVAGQ